MTTRILAALALLAMSAVASAQQTVIVHQPAQRVIVEHHYPQGVTHIPGQGGSRTYVYGGHAGPSTCYRECFHQGRGQTVIINNGGGVVHRPRNGWSISGGISIGATYGRTW